MMIFSNLSVWAHELFIVELNCNVIESILLVMYENIFGFQIQRKEVD